MKSSAFAAFGLACALAGPSVAQSFDVATQTAGSPFGFAKSDRKAEALKDAQAEAEASGSRVIGGDLAAEGAWPWQVALMIAGRPRSPDNQFCGGSIVLDTWVLTAAHCIKHTDENGEPFDLPPRAMEVLVGTNTLTQGGDLIPVVGVFPHPGYDAEKFDNDIALLKLARPPQTAYETIKVPDAEFGDRLDQPGVPLYVTGWGLINGAKAPDRMYEAKIQMLDRNACNGAMMEARAQEAVKGFVHAARVFSMDESAAQEAWEELIRRAPLPMTDNMLCSGTYEGGRTSCQGDSGGPLVVPLADGGFVQAGIVSWGLTAGPGKSCAEDAKFSAYTRVSNYLPWLDQVIAANP